MCKSLECNFDEFSFYLVSQANTHVIGCRVDVGGVVNVVDTWNPSPNYSPNLVDTNQDGVYTYNANYNGARLLSLS